MEHPLVYQQVKITFLDCRRLMLVEVATHEEVTARYEQLREELESCYGLEVVEQVMATFEGDLRLLSHISKTDWLGPVAKVYGYLLAFVISDEKIERVLRLNSDIEQSDASTFEA